MKTPEDEAFDDLAKRQGAWGGGYPAKKAMAADKLQEPVHSVQSNGRHSPLLTHMMNKRTVLAQPAQQEPPSEWAGIKTILDEYGLQAIDFVADFKAALAQPAQEPVAECVDDGEGGVYYRTIKKHIGLLYTAPPQRKWVGLTEDELLHIGVATGLERAAAQMIADKLKEKNNET